jgi:hypothetical protein
VSESRGLCVIECWFRTGSVIIVVVDDCFIHSFLPCLGKTQSDQSEMSSSRTPGSSTAI